MNMLSHAARLERGARPREIIAWRLRLFVPTGERGPGILGSALERHPLVRVASGWRPGRATVPVGVREARHVSPPLPGRAGAPARGAC